MERFLANHQLLSPLPGLHHRHYHHRGRHLIGQQLTNASSMATIKCFCSCNNHKPPPPPSAVFITIITVNIGYVHTNIHAYIYRNCIILSISIASLQMPSSFLSNIMKIADYIIRHQDSWHHLAAFSKVHCTHPDCNCYWNFCILFISSDSGRLLLKPISIYTNKINFIYRWLHLSFIFYGSAVAVSIF